MSESSKIAGTGKAARKVAERRRLAAALRENLKRRKAQMRGRGTVDVTAEPSPAPHDFAGFADDKQSH
ncbi:MAG TPA: hypothetical protein VKW08_03975 [Xanthobacteraceae bacterium]|jgi:hypothetical protein|nr:hypothetical protein [Xanthobacteraceae bacterium]